MTFSPQNFVNQNVPAVSAAWLNGVDVTCNFVLNGAQTVAQAQAALGITAGLTPPITGAQGGTGSTVGVGTVINAGVDTGAANAYVVSIPTAAMGGTAALTAGQIVAFTAANNNTGASTINVGGTGVVGLIGQFGGALVGGEILSTDITLIRYNGANWQILAQSAPQTRTAAEITAGVTPVNYLRPPGDVDRYATNTTPGTTDMTAAFNAAASVVMVNGGELTYGYTKLYLVSSGINLTNATNGANQPGIKVRSLGLATTDASSASNTFGIQYIGPTTTTAVFDCTGNTSVTFEDVGIGCPSSTQCPQTGILFARNQFAGSVINRMRNVRIVGFFGQCAHYNYGAEDCVYEACYFEQRSTVAGKQAVVFTANNIKGIVSQFTTIASGAQSMTDITMNGCQLLNVGGTGTSDCLYLEQVANSTFESNWMYSASATANGNALIYVDMTNAPSVNISIFGLHGEYNATHLQAYGILFSNHSQTPTEWTIYGCNLPCAGNSIASAGVNPTMDNFHISRIGLQTGGGILWGGTIQNSTIDSGYTTTAGAINNCSLIGNSAGWTINGLAWGSAGGSALHCSVTETGTANRSFAPGIPTSTSGTWTISGAVTQRGKLDYNSNKANFTIVFSAATNIACTAGTTLTLPFTATDAATARITDSSNASLGDAYINGSTLTLPAITTNSHTIVIEGFAFVS